MYHINSERGQTIVEAVIALASIMLTLAAISVAITTSLTNSEFSKKQSLAGRYAQEGLEKIRYLRNVDPATFASYPEGIHCMGADGVLRVGTCNAVSNPADIIDGAFTREVEFTQGTSECGIRPTIAPSSAPESGTQVTVEVKWSTGKCSSDDRFCHNVRLTSCFSDNVGSGSLL